ncbi:MAG: NAD(P)H-dependent oxidoreductase subunit E [Candidatus Promineifilaceae bacterium]
MIEKIQKVDGRPEESPAWQDVNRALKRFGYRQDALIEILHIAQEGFGYLSPPVLTHISRQLKLPLSWVYGVASFYHFFSFQKAPQHSCVVCTGTACYVEGAQEIISLLEEELGIKVGETTADGRFRLIDFRCPGSCGLAPIMVLDGEMLGRETPASALEKVRALLTVDAKEETAE